MGDEAVFSTSMSVYRVKKIEVNVNDQIIYRIYQYMPHGISQLLF